MRLRRWVVKKIVGKSTVVSNVDVMGAINLPTGTRDALIENVHVDASSIATFRRLKVGPLVFEWR